MAAIDWILNVVCALLWFNWRALRVTPLEKSPPVSLAATLKTASPRRRRAHWIPITSLAALVLVRSLFYWNVGPSLTWTPTLELGVISLPFRSDYLDRMLLYSAVSFGLVLAGVYAWLLLISIVNRRLPNDEPAHRLVRWQLGWVERWPAWLKCLLPILLTTFAWGLANPGLVQLGIVPAPVSRGHLWQQALLLGLNSLLTWKLLIMGICVLYLLNSYVYLGNSLFWNYVDVTGTNLLRPFRKLPLCVGKVDFAPVIAIVGVLALGHWTARWLPLIFQRLPY